MQIINATINSQNLNIQQSVLSVANSVNAYKLVIEYDEMWDNVDRKIVTFSSGNGKNIAVEDFGEGIVIPWEVLQFKGNRAGEVVVGVIGYQDTTIKLTTTGLYKTNTFLVMPEAAGMSAAMTPTPDIFQKLLQVIGDPAALDTTDKSSLVNAINEVLSQIGEGGVTSVNGQTGDVTITAEGIGAASSESLGEEITARENADLNLQNEISGKQTALTEEQLTAVNSGIDSTKVGQIATNTTNIGTNTGDIATINGKIPAQASTSNQLADKAFVTDAVQTNSAHFRGNWATWNDVPTDPTEYPIDDDGNHTPTSNDYMVVQDASGFPTSPDPALEGTWRFKYSGVWDTNGKNGWHPEYQVNETPLTSDQLAALNSGITAEAVTKLSGIETGAEVNNIDSISVNGTTVTPDANKNVALTIPTGETIKVLTTADYNYPTTGTPTSLAPWFLNTGVYKASGGMKIRYAGQTGSNPFDWTIASDAVVIVGGADSNNRKPIYVLCGQLSYFATVGTDNIAYGFDSSESISPLSRLDIANDLTTVSPRRPLSAAQGKYLNDTKADKTAFTGTDGQTAGTMGLVPAPATTDAGKVLGADGSWTTVDSGIKILTTADYDYPSDNPTAINANSLDDGIYIAGEQISVRTSIYTNSTFVKGGMIIKSDGAFLTHLSGTNAWAWRDSFSSVSSYNLLSIQNLANNLTSTDGTKALSAPQGKVLNEKIGDLTTLTTTAKTSAVAAINELDSDLADTQALSGSGAPTASTVGAVGQFYVDTTTGDIYYLSAIVPGTDPDPDTYTWNKVAKGADTPTVVQVLGTSQTDVMSQAATTGMIYADAPNKRRIRIGNAASNTSSSASTGVAVGDYSSVSANYAIALGSSANAEAANSIAIGGGTGSSTTADVRGQYTIAIGDTGRVYPSFSVCVGSKANIPSQKNGSIALGAYSGSSIADIGTMDIGSSNTTYGYNSSNYRLLTGVYDGQSAHDAATVGQLPATLTNSQFNAILEA